MMDSRHFDALTRTLTEMGTRRGILGLLATLPVTGGLMALLDEDEADAKRRRKRRKKRRKHHKKTCKPESKAKTCAGTCGPVTNNCKQTVDCGSCICDPPCPRCQTCDLTTLACQPDPTEQGRPCDPHQACTLGTCQDGTCVAQPCGGQAPLCFLDTCVSCGAYCDIACAEVISGGFFCSDGPSHQQECAPCTSDSSCPTELRCLVHVFNPQNVEVLDGFCPLPPVGQGVCIRFPE